MSQHAHLAEIDPEFAEALKNAPSPVPQGPIDIHVVRKNILAARGRVGKNPAHVDIPRMLAAGNIRAIPKFIFFSKRSSHSSSGHPCG